MASLIKRLIGGTKKKKLPQLGGSNPQNIDALVVAGEITKEEGELMKKRLKEKNEGKAK